MTKIEMYEQIKEHLTDATEIDFIEKQIETIRKRNTNRSNKPTAKQIENEGLKARILTALETIGGTGCIADIAPWDEELHALSNQKVSALLKQLVDEGTLIRTFVKRKAFYSFASKEE